MTPAVKALERQGIAHTVHRYEVGERRRACGEAVRCGDGCRTGDRLQDPGRTAQRWRAGGGRRPGDRHPGSTLSRGRGWGEERGDGGTVCRREGNRVRHRGDQYRSANAGGFACSWTPPLSAAEKVYVSAGRRGLQVEVSPGDLVLVTGATNL